MWWTVSNLHGHRHRSWSRKWCRSFRLKIIPMLDWFKRRSHRPLSLVSMPFRHEWMFHLPIVLGNPHTYIIWMCHLWCITANENTRGLSVLSVYGRHPINHNAMHNVMENGVEDDYWSINFKWFSTIKICRVSACYFGNKAIFGTTQNQSDEESRIVQTIESSEFLFPSDINIRSIQTLSTALLHFLKPNSKNEIFKLPLRFS